jgi:hypothetical protein
VFFYYDAKLKGKIKIENMASPRRLPKCGSYYEKCRFVFLFSLCYIVDLQKNIVRVMRI